MTTYYKRLQTIFSYGEEDLYDFVNGQKMKNSAFIKKLIRDEMLRQAGHTVEPTPKATVEKEVTEKIDLDDGGVMF